MPPTHFLCLPLVTSISRPQLEASLAHLRTLTENGDCKVPESAYRPLGVLHLTLGVMTLSADRLKEALRLLQETDLLALLTGAGNRPRTTTTLTTSKITTLEDSGDRAQIRSSLSSLTRPVTPPTTSFSQSTVPSSLTISLVGLSAFPEPRKATVLHAKPHDTTKRLYHFALALRQNFINAGFMAADGGRPLVLHATLVNTVYSKRDAERKAERGRRGQGKITLDASRLIRLFEGGAGVGEEEGDGEKKEEKETAEPFVWANMIEISSVRICRMGAVKIEDQGLGMEYLVVGEKKIFDM